MVVSFAYGVPAGVELVGGPDEDGEHGGTTLGPGLFFSLIIRFGKEPMTLCSRTVAITFQTSTHTVHMNHQTQFLNSRREYANCHHPDGQA